MQAIVWENDLRVAVKAKGPRGETLLNKHLERAPRALSLSLSLLLFSLVLNWKIELCPTQC